MCLSFVHHGQIIFLIHFLTNCIVMKTQRMSFDVKLNNKPNAITFNFHDLGNVMPSMQSIASYQSWLQLFFNLNVSVVNELIQNTNPPFTYVCSVVITIITVLLFIFIIEHLYEKQYIYIPIFRRSTRGGGVVREVWLHEEHLTKYNIANIWFIRIKCFTCSP